jgi:DnaJ-class molecular chaperone
MPNSMNQVSNTQGTVFNPIRRSFIRPKESEIFCPVCKGAGEVPEDHRVAHICERCLGKGILDWIERIMKK